MNKLTTIEQICEWLDSRNIADYKIREDLIVDVNGDVDISYKFPEWYLDEYGEEKCMVTEDKVSTWIVREGIETMRFFNKIKEIPVSFGVVTGKFNCSDNILTSLKGAPTHVGGDFDCSGNKLTSIEFLPATTSDSHINICGNNINTLQGSPRTVEGKLICDVHAGFLQGDKLSISAVIVRPERYVELRRPITEREDLQAKVSFATITPAQPGAVDQRPSLDIDLKGSAEAKRPDASDQPAIEQPSVVPTKRFKL